MIKIGVLSDTHIPNRASDLPNLVYEKLKDVNLIFHAGDLVEVPLLRKLENITEVIAVKGNMDSEELKSTLPTTEIIDKEGFRIGLTHGYGSPKETINNVRLQFPGKKLDIIVFGHTHTPYNEVIDDTIYFNPGSPTDRVFSPYISFGIITLTDTINTEIIRLDG